MSVLYGFDIIASPLEKGFAWGGTGYANSDGGGVYGGLALVVLQRILLAFFCCLLLGMLLNSPTKQLL